MDSIGIIIGMCGGIILIIGCIGSCFYVKFRVDENERLINKILDDIIPAIRKERVHVNDCKNREVLVQMQTERLEEQIEGHTKILHGHSKILKQIEKNANSSENTLKQILEEVKKGRD